MYHAYDTSDIRTITEVLPKTLYSLFRWCSPSHITLQVKFFLSFFHSIHIFFIYFLAITEIKRFVQITVRHMHTHINSKLEYLHRKIITIRSTHVNYLGLYTLFSVYTLNTQSFAKCSRDKNCKNVKTASFVTSLNK